VDILGKYGGRPYWRWEGRNHNRVFAVALQEYCKPMVSWMQELIQRNEQEQEKMAKLKKGKDTGTKR
jgi:hypothetical protein